MIPVRVRLLHVKRRKCPRDNGVTLGSFFGIATAGTYFPSGKRVLRFAGPATLLASARGGINLREAARSWEETWPLKCQTTSKQVHKTDSVFQGCLEARQVHAPN